MPEATDLGCRLPTAPRRHPTSSTQRLNRMAARVREGTTGRLKNPARSTSPHIDTSDQPLPGPANPTLQKREWSPGVRAEGDACSIDPRTGAWRGSVQGPGLSLTSLPALVVVALLSGTGGWPSLAEAPRISRESCLTSAALSFVWGAAVASEGFDVCCAPYVPAGRGRGSLLPPCSPGCPAAPRLRPMGLRRRSPPASPVSSAPARTRWRSGTWTVTATRTSPPPTSTRPP